MRIVHCEDFFHPDAGYQVNILARYMQSKGHDVIILTSELEKMPSNLTDFFGKDNIKERDHAYTKETGVKIIRFPLIAYFSGRSIYRPGYFKKLDSLKPDVAYIHGADTYLGIRCVRRYKRFKYPVLFDVHMTALASINPLRNAFRKFFCSFIATVINKNKITVIRPQDDDFVFSHYGICPELSPHISFGSNLQLFHPDASSRSVVRNELGIARDSFVVIYAGKLDEAKGGLLLARTIKGKFATKKNLTFLIVGNTASFNAEYKKSVDDTLSMSENEIVRISTQPYSKLNKFFQCSDIAVFPAQCSLTFFDAQACGLPVLLEDAYSLNVDRVRYNNGMLFKSGDVEDFREKIAMMADMPDKEMKSMKESSEKLIRENYNYDDIANKYLDVVKRVKQKWDVKRNLYEG